MQGVTGEKFDPDYHHRQALHLEETMNFEQFHAKIIEWASTKSFFDLQQIATETLLVLFVAIFIVYKMNHRYHRRSRWYNKRLFVVYDRSREHLPRPDLSNPKIAIKYVQESQYSVRPLMNKAAYLVFQITEQFFKKLSQGHRVIPEICMGAVLQCPSNEGFSSINSKRIDIGVIDWTGNLGYIRISPS